MATIGQYILPKPTTKNEKELYLVLEDILRDLQAVFSQIESISGSSFVVNDDLQVGSSNSAKYIRLYDTLNPTQAYKLTIEDGLIIITKE